MVENLDVFDDWNNEEVYMSYDVPYNEQINSSQTRLIPTQNSNCVNCESFIKQEPVILDKTLTNHKIIVDEMVNNTSKDLDNNLFSRCQSSIEDESLNDVPDTNDTVEEILIDDDGLSNLKKWDDAER